MLDDFEDLEQVEALRDGKAVAEAGKAPFGVLCPRCGESLVMSHPIVDPCGAELQCLDCGWISDRLDQLVRASAKYRDEQLAVAKETIEYLVSAVRARDDVSQSYTTEGGSDLVCNYCQLYECGESCPTRTHPLGDMERG